MMPRMDASNPIQTRRALYALLALVGVVFLPTVSFEFLGWDDPLFIQNNPLVHQLTFQNLKGMFSTYVTGNYIPLTLLSFAINAEIAGLEPWIFHATNVALHVFNVFLVFLLIRSLTGSAVAAWITAAFFGLHPLRVESVAWVTERKDLLFAAFYLGALLAWLRYRDTGKRRDAIWAFLLFAASCFSKQQAVSLPVVLVLIELFQRRRLERKAVFLLVPFFALAVLFAGVAVHGQYTSASLKAGPMFSPAHRALLASHSLGFYIFKQVWPHPLSAIYEYPENVIAHSAFSPIRALIVVGLFLWFCRRNRTALFAGGFFFVTLLPMLNLFPAGSQVVADRFTYLPAVGFGLLVALAAIRVDAALASRGAARVAARGVALVLLVALAWLTVQRNRVWKNDYTLWTATLEVMPESYTALINLGLHHLHAQEIDEAERMASKLMELYPGLMDGPLLMGLIRHSKGQFDSAVAHYSRTIALDPYVHTTFLQRGNAYLEMGYDQEALQDFEQALVLDPAQPEAWHQIGMVHARREQLADAIDAFTRALDLAPNQPDALFNRGRAHALRRRMPEAIADMTRLLELDPLHHRARYQRMLAYLDSQQPDAAFADARVLMAHRIEIPRDVLDRLNAAQGGAPVTLR